MSNIVIFGTGGMAGLLSKHKKEGTHIVAFLDTTENAPIVIDGIPVINLDRLGNIDYDYIVIAFSQVTAALKQLASCGGICASKIVGYSFGGTLPYDENDFQKATDDLLGNMLRNSKFEDLFDLPKKRFYLCGMNIPENYDVIESDYVREQTLDLIAREIHRKKLGGPVAELGVFQGDFSKKINRLFPEREIYLYDTFEGFDKKDLANDKSLSWEKVHTFEDTTVKLVLDKMPFPDKCIIKKGFFPDSFDEYDKKFAFVSIDVDLFDPIKSGLEIFYPRLKKGGYIMLHDYNSIVYHGATEAVQKYCDANEISYIPIPDIAGSVIITK